MTVNIKLLLSVILSCLPWGMLLADQKEDVKMQINKIKKVHSTFMLNRQLLQKRKQEITRKKNYMKRLMHGLQHKRESKKVATW